jgi:hypothetical protein
VSRDGGRDRSNEDYVSIIDLDAIERVHIPTPPRVEFPEFLRANLDEAAALLPEVSALAVSVFVSESLARCERRIARALEADSDTWMDSVGYEPLISPDGIDGLDEEICSFVRYAITAANDWCSAVVWSKSLKGNRDAIRFERRQRRRVA